MSQEVQLLSQQEIDIRLKYYDQQIKLAGKIKTLAELNADIAKARATEVHAMVQIAGMSAPEPEDAKEVSKKTQGPVTE
jgi:hypothetical protein